MDSFDADINVGRVVFNIYHGFLISIFLDDT